VTFGGNIAVPTGGTVEAISVALALNGEALGSSTMIVTPAAVEEYFNVFGAMFVDVPKDCCLTASIQNTSTQAILVQNANLIIERVA
jgi:cysteine synthase